MSQSGSKEQPKPATASKISAVFGPVQLLPGESLDAYKEGLASTIQELGASTHLQIYLAEKIFQCMWWVRRYENQKEIAILNSVVEMLTKYDTDKEKRHAVTLLIQSQRWDDDEAVKKMIQAAGHTAHSLVAAATSQRCDEIIKIDSLIALRIKTLGQLQQSYEALVNRSIMAERLKMQNELLKRDLQAIDLPVVETSKPKEVKGNGKPKAKSGK